MNDTDLDIILAIADGQLTGQAKQDALARIASDPELGEELAAQISAMDDLKTLEPALMTASERTVLRSALTEQLNLQPAAPVVAAAKSPRPWWQPVLGLASAAALLVAIVAVPSLFSSSDDSSADVVANAPQNLTNTEATPPTSATATNDDSAGASDQEEAATALTDSNSTQITLPEVEGQAVDEYFVATPQLSNDADTDEDASESAADEDGADTEQTRQAAVDAASIEACLDSLADTLPQGDHSPVAATTTDSGAVVHFGIETDDGIVRSFSIDLETCTITSLSP